MKEEDYYMGHLENRSTVLMQNRDVLLSSYMYLFTAHSAPLTGYRRGLYLQSPLINCAISPFSSLSCSVHPESWKLTEANGKWPASAQRGIFEKHTAYAHRTFQPRIVFSERLLFYWLFPLFFNDNLQHKEAVFSILRNHKLSLGETLTPLALHLYFIHTQEQVRKYKN